MANTTITDPHRRDLWERSLVGDANLDGDLLAQLWHEEGSFQIANFPKVQGREAIRGFFKQFFSYGLFMRLEHEMLQVWDLPDVLIYNANAIYTRKDGSKLVSPYVNVVRYSDGLFGEYQVFIDTKPLLG